MKKTFSYVYLFLCLLMLTACGEGATTAQSQYAVTAQTMSTSAPDSETESVQDDIFIVEKVEFVEAYTTKYQNNDEAKLTIRNNAAQHLFVHGLTVAFLDKNGDILENGYGSDKALLSPGQAITYTVEFYEYAPYAIQPTTLYYGADSNDYQSFYFFSSESYICTFEDNQSNSLTHDTLGDDDNHVGTEVPTEVDVDAPCDHTMEEVMTVYGVQTYMCRKCSFTYTNLEHWKPLSSLKLLSNSNNKNTEVGEIVAVGDWTAESGVVFPESIKFEVSSEDSKKGRAYTKYHLDGKYSAMTGGVFVSNLSDTDASMFIRIHLDNKQVYECEAISGQDYYDFAFEVLGVDTVLIECVTRDPAEAHCIVVASVRP